MDPSGVNGEGGGGPAKSRARLIIEAHLRALPPAQAKGLNRILEGSDSRLKRALEAYVDDSRFAKLDTVSQRRALAAFQLRR